MILRLKKHKDLRHTLTIVRDDGSTTWSDLRSLPPQHDLAHVAVEATLELPDSFLSLVNRGWDIGEFGEGAARAERAVPGEAAATEHIVATLTIEAAAGEPLDDLADVVRAQWAAHGVQGVPLPVDSVAAMRQLFHALCEAWRDVEPGGTLERQFEPAATSRGRA